MQDLNGKLKLLKVVDLKAILAKANVTVAPRANKADLISKIIASQAALDLYYSLYPASEKLAVQPVSCLSLCSTDAEKPSTAVEPTSTRPLATTISPAPRPAEKSSKTDDTEAEKRRKRAARFGIALAESPNPNVRQATTSIEDIEKLNARAARFGTTAKKRTAPTEKFDPQETEKRRKRAERFNGV